MRKVKIMGVLLISSLILISVGNFTIAQDSSYIGISEGEEYIWDLGLNKEGVKSLKDDSEILVQELLNDLLTLDLGAYTDLNVSEAILLGFNNSIELLPDDWKTLNISTFMENLFDSVVETFNSSFLSGAIPYDWKSESIVDFFDHMIEGLNKTIPGFANFTLAKVLETIINFVNDIIPFELLPVGWEDMTISNLIETYLGNKFNVINTTILPGMIPSDWLHMGIGPLLQNIFPILPQTLIDQIFPSSTTGFSIYSIIEMYVQNFNFTLGGLIPANWSIYTLSDLIVPFIPQGYEDCNVSYALDELFENMNNSVPFDLYSLSMSSLINMSISAMTSSFSIEQKTKPTIDLLRAEISSMLLAFNSTRSEGIFPDDWMSLTIDKLRESYVNQAQILFDQLMDQVDSFLYEFELLGGFEKVGLKAVIDYIGDEIELIPGGPKGVPINISIQIKVPLSDWVDLTNIIGFNIFQYYQIYILDPTTFSVDKGALIEQFLSTGGLFIGNGYDWSGINKVKEISGPDPDKFLKFEIDWNDNGVLDYIQLEYDGQKVASIELQTATTEAISGYNTLIFIGITLFTMGVLLSSIKKKKTKF